MGVNAATAIYTEFWGIGAWLTGGSISTEVLLKFRFLAWHSHSELHVQACIRGLKTCIALLFLSFVFTQSFPWWEIPTGPHVEYRWDVAAVFVSFCVSVGSLPGCCRSWSLLIHFQSYYLSFFLSTFGIFLLLSTQRPAASSFWWDSFLTKALVGGGTAPSATLGSHPDEKPLTMNLVLRLQKLNESWWKLVQSCISNSTTGFGQTQYFNLKNQIWGL